MNAALDVVSPSGNGGTTAPSPAAGAAPPAAPPVTAYPLIGTIAVLLGAIISTLNGRLTSFGLADVEGAVHAGFDEGAWITTSFTVGQMMIALVAAWLGATFGIRRVFIVSCVVFSLSNFLLPFSPNLGFVLLFQNISGVASGTFIPLTIGFVLLNLPPKLVVYGVAAYAVNLELSLNISASVEGWFDTHWSWRWIFWDTAALAIPMLICVLVALPRQATNMVMLKKGDWPGMFYLSAGLSLIYAALDQGNRLDWLNSGLVDALFAGGGILIAAFIVRELTQENPWINFKFSVSGNLPLLGLYIAFFRVVILSTSYIIPQYLITVQNYRALEIGGVLIWIALPQFVLGPVVATILRFVDARVTMAVGLAFVGGACFLASQLTGQWASADFLPSQLLQAVGQTLTLTSVVWLAVVHIDINEVFTIGTILQIGRLFGSEIGSAFIQTFVRMREQIYSNYIGQHVIAGNGASNIRLQDYFNAVFGRSVGPAAATGRSLSLLSAAIRKQAYVLAYIDGFLFLGYAVVIALILMLLLRDPPEQSVIKTRLSAAMAKPKAPG